MGDETTLSDEEIGNATADDDSTVTADADSTDATDADEMDADTADADADEDDA